MKRKRRWMDSPWWMDSKQTDTRQTGSKAMWHPRGLSGLQEISNGNVLCPMGDTIPYD